MRKEYILVLVLLFPVALTSNGSDVQTTESNDFEEIEQDVEYIQSDLTAHGPIAIHSDLDFELQGWPGQGTPESPYTISNLSISTYSSSCIRIENTRSHFKVIDCAISSLNYYDGMYFMNVTNGNVVSCGFKQCPNAIAVTYSTHVNIANVMVQSDCYRDFYFVGVENSCVLNSTFHSSSGPYLHSCSNSTIMQNAFYRSQGGLRIVDCLQMAITQNAFTYSCINIAGYGSDYYNQTITENTINGKQIGYFYDIHGQTIVGDYGSLLLYYCSGLIVTSLDFADVMYGIDCRYSPGCVFSDIRMDEGGTALYIYESDSAAIDSCTLSVSSNCISLQYSDHSNIRNCVANSGSESVYSYRSDDLIIRDNLFETKSPRGIYLGYSINCLISNNIITVQSSTSDSASDAIYFSYMQDSDVVNNTLVNGELEISGDVNYWNHHVEDNSVDGKPLVYYFSLSDSLIEGGVYGEILAANCTDTVFTDIVLENASSGFHISCSTNCSITDMVLANTQSGICIDQSDEIVVKDVRIENNLRAVDILDSDNCTMGNITATENRRGVCIHYSSSIVVTNCNLLSSQEYGAYIYSSQNINFTHNNVESISDNDAISMSNCEGSTISYCNISTSSGIGIRITGNNVTISGNFITNSYEAIYIRYSMHVSIQNNTLENNNIGCYAYHASNCSFSENTIAGNDWYSIELSYSSYCKISKNQVVLNEIGLYIRYSDNNTVTNNNVTLNRRYGIGIYSGEENTLFSNTISRGLDGTAYDEGADNTWDNGLDTGNYWSDYNGSLTYQIRGNANSTDRYPMLAEDTAPPMIIGPDDFGFEYRASSYGPYLIWKASDYNPSSMTIICNGIVDTSGPWNGDWIDLSLQTLKPGFYNYTLLVSDTSGRSASDTVFVDVWTNPDAIVIISNQDFISQGWPGTGTAENPYVVADLNISVATSCILLEDTQSYVRIQNCTLSSPSQDIGNGIWLENAQNVQIKDCTVYKKEIGILARQSSVEIRNSHVFDNSAGIVIDHCALGYLEGNIVSHNGRISSSLMYASGGIYITYSPSAVLRSNIIEYNLPFGVLIAYGNAKVLDNALVDNGFFFSYYDSTQSPSPALFEENTVNGKAFGYFRGKSNLELSGDDYGQLILIDCEEVVIRGGLFTASLGCLISYCENCLFEDVTMRNNSLYGMAVLYSQNILIRSSNFIANAFTGAYCSECVNVTMENCIFADNCFESDYYLYQALVLYNCRDCSVLNNTVFRNNFGGIYAYRVYNSSVLDNIVCSNLGPGMRIRNPLYSQDEIETGITLYGNSIGWNYEDAIDESAINHWDNGIDEGNAWSTYSGAGSYIVPGSSETVNSDSYPMILSDQDVPVIEDLTSAQVECGNAHITWNCYDSNPVLFKVRVNGSYFDIGIWRDSSLTVDVSKLKPGIYDIEIIVYDMPGNNATDHIVVTVTDTTAPYWDPTPTDQYVEYDTPFSHQVSASDNDRIDYYLLQGSEDFTIDANGLITNATFLASGNHSITVRAYDPSGNYCQATFNVRVLEQETSTTTDTTTPTDHGDIVVIVVVIVVIIGGVMAAIFIFIFIRRRPQ